MKKIISSMLSVLIALSAVRFGAFLIDREFSLFNDATWDKLFLKSGYIVFIVFLWVVVKRTLLFLFPESEDETVDRYMEVVYNAYVIKQKILIKLFGKHKVKGMKLYIKSKDLFMDTTSYSR